MITTKYKHGTLGWILVQKKTLLEKIGIKSSLVNCPSKIIKKISLQKYGNPLQYSCLENSMD